MQDQSHSYLYQSVDRMRRIATTLMIVTALVLGGLQASPVQARIAGLPDFTAIVEKSEAAVVNIRTTAKVSSRAGGGGGAPGQDPYELFRHFFGPDLAPPGGRQGPQQAPRGRRAEP